MVTLPNSGFSQLNEVLIQRPHAYLYDFKITNGHVTTPHLICAIRFPLRISCLFAHLNYLGSKLDYDNSQPCLSIYTTTTIKK